MFNLTQREKNENLANALGSYNFSKERLEKALRKGGDPNHANYSTPNMLFPVAELRRDASAKDAADLLLKAGADITKTDGYGRNALHNVVVRNGAYTETIKRFMQEKFDLNAVDNYGRTLLFDALAHQHWDLASMLMDAKGTEVTAAKKGKTLLMEALERDVPLELVKRLLAETKVDVNAISKEKEFTPALTSAALKAEPEYLDLLLAIPGIKVDVRNAEGRTPLMSAVVNGNKQSIAALLAAKASPDAEASDGETPLAYATASGSQEVVDMLVAAGAALDKPGAHKRTAITIASAGGNIPMVMALLAAAKEQDIALGLTEALHAAAERGHGRIIELLIATGADVNAPDDKGRTPLMKAALSDEVEALGILMKAGAQTDMIDRQGMNPYDHAVSKGKINAKNFLANYREKTARGGPTPEQQLVANEGGYTRLNDHSLEVREGSLSITFNFWTQQVVHRDIERSVPLVIQDFADLPRQEAVTEAWEKLKALGGNPPDPRVSSVQKKTVAPGLSKP